MIEKKLAGIREFIYSALWAVLILVAYDFVDTFMRLTLSADAYGSRNMILTVTTIALACVLVYIVLTRYASSFIYEVTDKKIIVTSKTGHREKTVEVKYKDILEISKDRPQDIAKKVYKMGKSVFSKKNTYYMLFISEKEKQIIEFEPSDEMAFEIKKKVKEG